MISLQSVVVNDHHRNALSVKHSRIDSNEVLTFTRADAARDHPLVYKRRIEVSLIQWVRTFDTLHFFPKTLKELINSFTLYEMLTEMDTTYFPYLDRRLLKID